jgi:ABC-type transport system substrate-binding protein
MRGRAAAILIGLVVAACTPDSEAPESAQTHRPIPRAGGEIAFGVLGEPPTLDPYAWNATDLTWAAVRPLYPSLYSLRPDGTPEPYLARSLTEASGGVRVSLVDTRWSDGKPITARDVVATIRRARPPSGFARLRSARAVDDATVQLVGDISNWQQTLATLTFVLPRGRPQGPGGVFGGPFALTRYRPGLELEYGRNPEWTGSGPYVNEVRLQFVANLGFLIALVKDGSFDAALLPSSVNLDERLDEMGIDYVTELGWERIYLDFDGSGLARGVRAVIVGGIDRDALAEAFVRDDGRLSDTLHPAPGAEPIAPGPYEREPGRTADPDGEVLMSAPSGDELLAFIARAMQQQLIGKIDLELATGEIAAVYSGGYGDPGGALIRRAAGIPGATDPVGAVRSLDAWPLFQAETVVAVGPRLRGVVVNPTVEGPLWNAERWWLDRR